MQQQKLVQRQSGARAQVAQSSVQLRYPTLLTSRLGLYGVPRADMASYHPTASTVPEHKAPLYDTRNFPGSELDLVVELAVPVTKTDVTGHESTQISLTHLQLEIPQSDGDTAETSPTHTHRPTTSTFTSKSTHRKKPQTPVPVDSAKEAFFKAKPVSEQT